MSERGGVEGTGWGLLLVIVHIHTLRLQAPLVLLPLPHSSTSPFHMHLHTHLTPPPPPPHRIHTPLPPPNTPTHHARAVGESAAAQAVRLMRGQGGRFRLLGLSATPGNEHNHIQVKGGVYVAEGCGQVSTRRLGSASVGE